ncbi:MAG: universal stress protein [Actinobacteria bacterium]|nr:universal stress protein [Actinomycetota bacterium]
MVGRVLIPIDFSAETDKILRFTRGFKKLGLEKVVLVHIIDVRGVEYPVASSRNKKIQTKLKERKEIFDDLGIEVKTFAMEGIPHEEILSMAEEENISLIVACSHGKRLIEELLLGSVSERIGREAKTPVLLIKEEVLDEMEKKGQLENFAADIFRKVVIPTDFSECSEKALEYVHKLKNKGIEEVVILHVIDTKRLETEKEKEELERICKERLKKIKKRLVDDGFNVKTILKISNPLHEIIEISEKENVSLILMGSHGKSLVTEWLVGTVSLDVVRIGEKPALVVHEKDVCLESNS